MRWTGSAGVAEQDVLPGQLEQHGVVEEFVDGHVLGQALPPPVGSTARGLLCIIDLIFIVCVLKRDKQSYV
jgi:hypothetical protein